MTGQARLDRRYTTRLQKGGALVDEMRSLTLSWRVDASEQEGPDLVGLPSRTRARDVINRAFIPRFVQSVPPDLWKVAKALEQASADRLVILPLHYYAAAASEHLLWDFVVEDLYQKDRDRRICDDGRCPSVHRAPGR